MQKIKLILMAPLLIILLGCAEQAPPAKVPIKDFFRNPDSTNYRISPDGKFLAFMKPYNRRMNIFIQPVGQHDAKRITAVTDRDISGYFWKGNNTLVYSRDFGGDENYNLFSIGREGKNEKNLTPFPGARAGVIDDLPEIEDELIIKLNLRNPEVFDAYRLNVKTGKLKMIAKNPGNIIGWGTDHNGKLRLALTSDDLKYSILFRDSEEEMFKNILTFDYHEDFSPLFFTFDNKQLYALSNLGRDKLAVVRFDPKSKKEVEVLFEDKEVDASGLSYSRKRKTLLAILYYTSKRNRVFLDKQTKRMYGNIKNKLKEYEVLITDSNKDEDLFLVRNFSDRSLGTYYLYDLKKNKLTKLADVSPWLDENNLTEMKPVEYKSRDGLTIHGYLTLPKGRKAKNLPTVIIPHGGPWARDQWGYDAEVQFLANRGYAVFQMNFRGSTGYGKGFEKLGYKQWGQKMQDDITDGVNWMIEKGIADPKRVAIYGTSYGGYAVLAGLAFTPDLYACGVDYVGVSNIFTLLKTIPPYWKPFIKMSYERIGHPEKDKQLLKQISPVFHADKIKAPLMVIQGAKDPRVNINESNQIVAALRKRGIDVPYIVKKNEGHGFMNEENRLEVYAAMEEFLAKHLSIKKGPE